jgi:hypothetical protein
VVIASTTVQQVCEEYATRRKKFNKWKLRWRVSNPKSNKRHFGWIPFKSGAVVYSNGQLQFVEVIEAIQEHNATVIEYREVKEESKQLEDGRKHHHGVISNPERVAACKTFAEITKHNQNVQKLEWERQVK